MRPNVRNEVSRVADTESQIASVLLIAPQIPHMSVLGAFLLVSGFLVVAAVIAQLAIKTRARRFEELSP
jgi:hypothetical protein